MIERKEHGSALVEFVLTIGIFIFFISALLAFTRFLIIKMRAAALAQYGVTLRATQLLDEEIIFSEMEDCMRWQLTGRDVDKEFVIKRYTETPSSRFYRFVVASVRCRYQAPFFNRLGLPELPIEEKAVVQEGVVP